MPAAKKTPAMPVPAPGPSLGPEITPERVLLEEARIAFSDPRAVCDAVGQPLPPHRLPEDAARALAAMEIVESANKSGESTVRYKYKFWDKRAALDRLARHLGLGGPSLEVRGPGEQVTFVLNLGGDGGGEPDPEADHG